ncbi:GNAT family N-acetyltransferase [Streptomyces curacoi]|uniref:GNAT family N-acetyltransferase n=1 Tax=Streptomyces curacoi TaxID=146536 RepID=UPI0007C830CC
MSRVELKTDARDERSRAAIASVGARFEGVLRNWSRSWVPGEERRLRDSAVFSITAGEWPPVRGRLEERVAGFLSRARAVAQPVPPGGELSAPGRRGQAGAGFVGAYGHLGDPARLGKLRLVRHNRAVP